MRSIELPITDGRPWRNTVEGGNENVMRIAADDGDGNTVSHWWDGSEVYGVDLRDTPTPCGSPTRPALRLEDGYLPVDEHGRPRTGFGDSWWLGLSVMHT